jgi:hypothetical protein
VDDPTQALILCAMAETAHDDGTEARASQATYARYARCSDRTLRRHLKAMEEAGVIRRGNQDLVAHLRADRRPVVWDLNMGPTAGQNDRPVGSGRADKVDRPDTVVRSMPLRPDNYDTNGRTLMSDKPKPEPSLKNEPSTLFPDPSASDPPSPPPVADRGFDEFWAAYPKKIGKTDAKSAWRKAVKRGADPDHIVRYATEQAAVWERHQKDPQYIPYPATWLNKARYLDEYDMPTQTPQRGHQPYRNPDDNSGYYEPLIASR